MVSNNLAVIPARSGSKRISKKNLVEFNGKPLIGWTIEAAINSNLFSKVIVSTDSEEIAEVSINFGAEVPFLREKYFDDISPVSLATLSALIQSENYWKIEFDTVTQLLANCPLRSYKDIIKFDKEFNNRDSDFLLSCFKFRWMNPWWAFTLEKNLRHNFLFEEALKQRSQDQDDLYCPTGSIWMANSKQLKIDETFYGKDHQFQEIAWTSAVDIDDEADLDFAKAVALTLNY
jgi:N-acylneuraminate cytidylyltransferase